MSVRAETLQQLDLRGLDPPEPMRRALEAIEVLADSEGIELVTEREPLLLYRELSRRGYRYLGERRSDGFHTTIRRGEKGAHHER